MLINKIKLITPAEVKELHGDDKIEAVTVVKDGESTKIETDHFIGLIHVIFQIKSSLKKHTQSFW